jgi:hypothetical protein
MSYPVWIKAAALYFNVDLRGGRDKSWQPLCSGLAFMISIHKGLQFSAAFWRLLADTISNRM